ncbi:MAG TPA: hypothetical protein VL092_07970, partial [Chitinophagaceae bacterium]|nr:hypothetical protein [Chitinophagaceae bacterium]
MKNYLILVLIALTVTSYSCQKKDIDVADKDKRSLQISKPVEAQVFRQNDTVWIVAKASYVSQLHGYALQLTDTANKTVYLDITEHVHGFCLFVAVVIHFCSELQLKGTACFCCVYPKRINVKGRTVY